MLVHVCVPGNCWNENRGKEQKSRNSTQESRAAGTAESFSRVRNPI